MKERVMLAGTCLFCSARDGKPPNFATKAIMGVTAGAVGSFIGTPAEISLIRMTADGRYVQWFVCEWMLYAYSFDSCSS